MGKKPVEIRELSLNEQRNINGGWLPVLIAVMGAFIYIYNNKEDLVNGMVSGYESVRK